MTIRIEKLGKNIENPLNVKGSECVYYSVALAESTNSCDATHLAIFIRGVDKRFKISEEMAVLFPVKCATKWADFFNCLQMLRDLS